MKASASTFRSFLCIFSSYVSLHFGFLHHQHDHRFPNVLDSSSRFVPVQIVPIFHSVESSLIRNYWILYYFFRRRLSIGAWNIRKNRHIVFIITADQFGKFERSNQYCSKLNLGAMWLGPFLRAAQMRFQEFHQLPRRIIAWNSRNMKYPLD